jgi:cation:H+ antiporter
MTVVAWCTSAPELVVSLGAALEGRSDIAIGNVVGSNIFNVLGVLGVAAVIAPIAVKPASLRRDVAWMLGSSVALLLIVQTGVIGRVPGVLLAIGIAVYVWYSYRSETRDPGQPSAEVHTHESEEIQGPQSAWVGVGYVAAGLAALVVGSRLLIIGATDIALALGVSEAAVGLTLVAVGTSLPELATSVVAAVRRHSDVAVGNVVGSNIFNILGILGLTAMMRPIEVVERIATVDTWIMLVAALVVAVLLVWRGRIGRLAAAVFLGAYVVYVVTLFTAGV